MCRFYTNEQNFANFLSGFCIRFNLKALYPCDFILPACFCRLRVTFAFQPNKITGVKCLNWRSLGSNFQEYTFLCKADFSSCDIISWTFWQRWKFLNRGGAVLSLLHIVDLWYWYCLYFLLAYSPSNFIQLGYRFLPVLFVSFVSLAL